MRAFKSLTLQLFLIFIFICAQIQEFLYPIVCSTAAKTEVILTGTRRDFANLQDRCRAEICKLVHSRRELCHLKLPNVITSYLADGVIDPTSTISPSSSSAAAVTSTPTWNTFDMYAV